MSTKTEPDSRGLLLVGASCLVGVLALLFVDRLPIRLYELRVFRGIVHLVRDARALLTAGVPTLTVFGLCFLSYLTLMLSIFLFVRGFGSYMRYADIVILLPPVLAASMLPVSLGGWGTRELAMVFALGTASIPAETALLSSFWLGIASILIALPGALFFAIDQQLIREAARSYSVERTDPQ